MTSTTRPRETLRFGDFTLDLSSYVLSYRGRPVKLERRPMDLLVLLVNRRGELVTRDEIIETLWGKDVFVDVDTGINTVIWKVRAALRDSKDEPIFVQTVAGRGYRFIAQVHVDSPAAVEPSAEPEMTAHAGRVTSQPRRRWVPAATAFAVLLVVAAGSALVTRDRPGAGTSGDRFMIAVLPFANVGGDPERQYLADGLTEETTASLSQIDPDHLTVIGRTSIQSYVRMGKTVDDIGRDFRVDYVVESALSTADDGLHVESKLIRTTDRSLVWSATYDRELANLADVQRELSTAIAEHVRLRLLPERVGELGRRQTKHSDAFDAYLKARYFENRRNRESTLRAIQYYQHAISLDPNYALAWSGLAFTFAASTINSDAPPVDVTRHAREAAAKAIAANPNLTESQFAAGYVDWMLDWKWAAAESALRRALELDPGNVAAVRSLGHALSQMGRHREAADALQRTRELDPFSPMNYAMSSQVAFQARDNTEAVKHARQAILIDSSFWIGYMQLAQAYGQMGETDVAFEALSDAARFSGGENSKTISLRGYFLAAMGRTKEAREMVRRLDAISRERYVPPYAVALVHAGLGERNAVFDWLDKAYAARDVHLMFLPVDPKWDAYRSDPRFEALIARCGFVSVTR